jgi:hypothetical protein
MSPPDKDQLSRRTALITVVLAVAAIAAGSALYGIFAPRQLDRGIVSIELGGRGQPYPLPSGTSRALWWDFTFIAGYGAALVLGIRTLKWMNPSPKRQRLVSFAFTSAIVTIAADCAENVFLLVATARPTMPTWLRDITLDSATAAAVLKFSMAVPATAGALIGVGITSSRLITSTRRRTTNDPVHALPPRPVEGDPPLSSGRFPVAPDDAIRWRNGYDVPDNDQQREPGKQVVGICVSGGGIRSASVAMGALQSLRSELIDADFLVSVSGGGYTAGALQQALTDAGPSADELGGEALHDPHTAFMFGGVEEDHVRRHSSYLANTGSRLILALGLIVRHMLFTLILLFGPAVVIGIVAGWFYAQLPVTDLSGIRVVAYQPNGTAANNGRATFDTQVPDLRVGALAALALITLVAILLWLGVQHAASRGDRAEWIVRRETRSRLAQQAALVLATVATLTVLIPAMAWAAAWVLEQARGVAHLAVGGPAVTVLLTYTASLAALVWRKRKWFGGQSSGLFSRTKIGRVAAAVPNGALQLALVVAAIAVLSLGWLLLFAAMILTAGDPKALWIAVAVAAVIAVLGGLVDETTLSMHPFYRQRLASAFAVRAVRRNTDSQIVAVPYSPAERTTLSHYGRTLPNGHKFPRVIFAASANLSGEERTPPGLNAVSYTFSGDWVGGPDIGWIKTEDLERLSPSRFKRDLTVQGAVAISGAAIASSMGKGARWNQILFAITGVRLGAWMPNPRFVLDTYTGLRSWDKRQLPRVRRLSYLLRELFNVHPHDDPLLQVTDGGHYENLGLVELFRRRCTRIYCIDASGDNPPTATTLSAALTLAKQELGVQVTLIDPWMSEPGSGEAFDPKDSLSALNMRLSKSPLIAGTFHYPPESGDGAGVGRLIVAKALLWPQLPYPLLSYAAKHSVFPHDSTGDQWFDDGQYAAYTELGRQLGTQASSAMQRMSRPDALA